MSRARDGRLEATDEVSDVTGRVLWPWWRRMRDRFDPLELVDVHTHIGSNDPDGFNQTPEALLAELRVVDARGVAFPMHEPDGYGPANDRAIAAARDSEGRLEALCRVDPRANADGCVAEAERCLDAGARGIKLHPRAEGFDLAEPAVERLFALADERRAPVLIHAGRGIPALGADAVRLARANPGARVILAHAGISDLAWIWREAEAGSNLFFDTAWWNPADLIALLTLVPSSQILLASDSPYGTPLAAAVCHLRCAQQAGVRAAAIRSIAGEQASRVLAGEDPVPLERPAGEAEPLDPALERVYSHLITAFGCSNGGSDPSEQVDLARLACRVPDEYPHAGLLTAVDELLARIAADYLPPQRSEHRYGDLERLLVAALSLVRTPAAD